jgi:peptide/nickel transport system permease protein
MASVPFLLRRLAWALLTLAVGSFVVFGAMYVAPGDPIAMLTGGRPLPPETLDSIREQYHLHDPFLLRYWQWLTDALQGDFGQSIQFRQDVSALITPRLGTTLILLTYSALLTIVIGIGLGAWAALRGGKTDTAILSVTSVSMAVPSFVTAMVLIFLFGVELKWLPTVGGGEGFTGRFQHLTLPAVALALASVAYVARLTRAAMQTELEREHVDMARSRGIPDHLVVRRHVLRNAMIPITTVMGVTVAPLVAGIVVVEHAFAVGGLGSLLIDAVVSKDFAVVQALVLVLIAMFILLNTLVDYLYALLDPRITLGGANR